MVFLSYLLEQNPDEGQVSQNITKCDALLNKPYNKVALRDATFGSAVYYYDSLTGKDLFLLNIMRTIILGFIWINFKQDILHLFSVH